MTKPTKPRGICWLGLHCYRVFIKAENYNPPQLFVAGCYVCARCGKEKWV